MSNNFELYPDIMNEIFQILWILLYFSRFIFVCLSEKLTELNSNSELWNLSSALLLSLGWEAWSLPAYVSFRAHPDIQAAYTKSFGSLFSRIPLTFQPLWLSQTLSLSGLWVYYPRFGFQKVGQLGVTFRLKSVRIGNPPSAAPFL